MRKMFRHTACILAALVLASAGTACGDTAATTETTTQTAESTVAVTEAVTAEYTAPEVDYAGETFTIGAISLPANSSPWKAVDYCET